MGPNFRLFHLYFLAATACLVAIGDSKPPIVIVPGDGGSRLQARLNKKTAPHFWCRKQTNYWYDIWLSVEELLPAVVDCWSDNMRMVFNTTTKKLQQPEGVEIRVPYFGGTDGIEYLDPSIDHPGQYFAALVQALVKIGYVRGKTLLGAPYDFRHAPNFNQDLLINLQNLIENATKTNGEPVMLISHSLGCPYTKYFLDQLDQKWKDKYIHSWMTIAGAWAGAAKLFRVLSSGTDLGIPRYVLEPIKLRPSTRMYGSTAFLLPSEKFWQLDEIIVYTPKKNYSLANLEEFYHDIHFDVGNDIRNVVPPVWTDHRPNVTLYCLYGTNVSTPETFHFKNNEFPDTFPKTITGDGDGTVNRRSLEGCMRYKETQLQPVIIKEFPNAGHMGIIGDKRVISFIINLLKSFD